MNIYVSYCDYLDGTPTINKPWFFMGRMVEPPPPTWPWSTVESVRQVDQNGDGNMSFEECRAQLPGEVPVPAVSSCDW